MKRIYRKTTKYDSEVTVMAFLMILILLWKRGYLKNITAGSTIRLAVGAAVILCLALALVNGIRYIVKRVAQNKRKKAYLNSRIHEIDRMSGVEFEELLKYHFERQGYKVTLTPKTNDYGGDLVLRKGNAVTVVQAKRYNSKLGNSPVQEVVASMAHYNAGRAMVVTNSYFSKNAIRLASENNVELWDRNTLMDTFKITG